MRFLGILKGSAVTEGYVPSQDEIAAMEAWIDSAKQEGWLIDTVGLFPSARAARVTYSGGKRTVTDGPFTEAKELIASYAVLEVASKEEAIEHTSRFLEYCGGEGECDLWQVWEP